MLSFEHLSSFSAVVTLFFVRKKQEVFQKLRKEYPGNKLLIVSNTAGTSDDKNYQEVRYFFYF